MTDESLLLDVEIMQKEHEKAMAELEKEIAAKDDEIAALKAKLAKYENV